MCELVKSPVYNIFLFLEKQTKIFCIPITFNNPLKAKASFSNKKYPITFQTCPTQIVKVYFLLKDRLISSFVKIIGAQNQLPMTFCSDLVSNKTLKARNSTPTHTNL